MLTPIEHISDEIGFHYVFQSVKTEFDTLQKCHDAIHEFLYLAYVCAPEGNNQKEVWLSKSAFLIYQWEIFDCAHRSFIEALCSYYNSAFILLRSTFELLIKGAFWECISHNYFRNDLGLINEISKSKDLKSFIEKIFNANQIKKIEIEKISSSIFDEIGKNSKNPIQKISIKAIIEQLVHWNIFSPIEDVVGKIMQHLFCKIEHGSSQ